MMDVRPIDIRNRLPVRLCECLLEVAIGLMVSLAESGEEGCSTLVKMWLKREEGSIQLTYDYKVPLTIKKSYTGKQGHTSVLVGDRSSFSEVRRGQKSIRTCSVHSLLVKWSDI
jgi:hypothetical protein